MQGLKGNTSELSGEEKSIGNRILSEMDAKSQFLRLPSNLVLQKLLVASKDAEVLIACLFEQQVISAKPFLHIWDRLADAISEAQQALRAAHKVEPSAPLNGG